jgi:hypothetical protein
MTDLLHEIRLMVPARGAQLLAEAITNTAVRAPDARILADIHDQITGAAERIAKDVAASSERIASGAAR